MKTRQGAVIRRKDFAAKPLPKRFSSNCGKTNRSKMPHNAILWGRSGAIYDPLGEFDFSKTGGFAAESIKTF